MDRNDRQAIADLFERLREAERRSPPRDRDAEGFIRERIAAQPAAPYYLAQTVIVQQQALEAAQDRIAELEGGAGTFGGRRRQSQRPGAAMPDNRAQPWGAAGGGFLAGAAQTALGVAGGVLLGNMIADTLFGGHDAYAADSQGDAGSSDPSGSGDFGGGDFGGDSGGGDGGGGD